MFVGWYDGCCLQVWDERGFVRRKEMEAPVAGTHEVARLRQSSVRRQHVVACWARYFGNEHGTALHEGNYLKPTR